MTRLLFTNETGSTTEIDLSGNGALVYLEDDGTLVAQPSERPFSGSGFIESVDDAQWTLTYNEGKQISFFIGVTDLDVSLTGKYHEFILAAQQLNIRNDGDTLTAIAGSL